MSNFKKIKIEVAGSKYIMLSTLNQMVNYIPIKLFNFDSVINITTDDSKNEAWDQAFKSVLGEEELSSKDIKLEHDQILKIDEVKDGILDAIEEIKTEKLFWNITGGQRPTILAIHDLVKELDDKIHYLCYLEGNSGKLTISKFQNGEQDVRFDGLVEYSVEGLTIKTALQLMSFDVSGSNLPPNIMEDETLINELTSFYQSFYNAYKGNNAIAQNLAESNQNNSNLSIIIDNLPTITNLTTDQLKTQWSKYNNKAFGYILEDMTLYLIMEAINNNAELKEKIAGVYHSTKINDSTRSDKQIIDEFDILILTKQGQVINFECKSGKMTGDVAKSTNYSTYAIAGVYGLPILITPMANNSYGTINDKIDKAINAAERARLAVWHLDEIESKLEDKLLK